MLDYRNDFKKRIKKVDGKKICYLCMEFLVGRALKNDAMNLGLYDELCDVLSDFGTTFDKVYACEVDPGLGNGGLGRLAACFMDSLTAQDYAANGYSLLYENGLFKQKIIDGEQVVKGTMLGLFLSRSLPPRKSTAQNSIPSRLARKRSQATYSV